MKKLQRYTTILLHGSNLAIQPNKSGDMCLSKDVQLLENECEEWKTKYEDLNRALRCELRDPKGTPFCSS